MRKQTIAFNRDLHTYGSPRIEIIYPTVPCPRGGQAENELKVTTTMDDEGWPCLSAVEDFHSRDTANDGSCLTGYCFYVSDHVALNIQVKDPAAYSYSGFNLLSWCKESVLVQGGVLDGKNAKAK